MAIKLLPDLETQKRIADAIEEIANKSTSDSKLSIKENSNLYVRSLGTKIVSGYEPIQISVIGDSTGNGEDEWVYGLAQWLKDYIDNYNIKYKLWLDSLQGYEKTKHINYGNLGDGYAKLNGGWIYTEHNSNLNPTDNIEIIAKIAPDSWTGSAQTIVSKFGGGGNRGYNFYISESNVPHFWYSDNGTDHYVIAAPNSISNVTNGEPKWVKVIFVVDDGAGNNYASFYHSDDGQTWTKIDNDVVRSGTTQIYPSNEKLMIGSRSGNETFYGKIYNVVIRNGVDGLVMASPDLGDAFPSLVTTFEDSENNTYTRTGDVEFGFGSPNLTILNASHPGANISYMSETDRFETICVMNPHITFISLGHNQYNQLSMRTDYIALLNKILVKQPYTGFGLIAQNPQVSPEPNIIPHAMRCAEVGVIASNGNHGFIDVYRAFMDTGKLEEYMGDGAHPNVAGSKLWLEQIKKFMIGALLK